MPKHLCLSLCLLAAGSVFGADPTPKEAVTAAANKLGDAADYSWKTVVAVPEEARFKPGPTEGKANKEGYALFVMSFFDNKVEIAAKGDQRAVTDQSGEWKSAAEVGQEEGPGRFMAMIARNLKTPVKEAAELAGYVKDWKREADVCSGELTEEGAKTLQSFGPRGGDNGPSVSNAQGSVKFWVKDGSLLKYEFKLKGLIKFGDNEFPNDRTTTVEVKDVGTTKLEIPEAARKKLS